MTRRIQSRSQQTRSLSKLLDYSPLENRKLLAADATVSIDFANDSGLIRTLATPVPMQDRFDVLQDVVDNIESNDSFRRTSLVRDEIGFAHIKHQQYRSGVPIEGATFTVHIKDRNVVSVSGAFLEFDKVDSENSLSEDDALQSALAFVDADLYMWESLQHDHGHEPGCTCCDCLASSQYNHGHHHAHDHELYSDLPPTGELIYLPSEGGTLELTWKFDVYAVAPLSRQNIFVDASSGDILETHDLIHHADVAADGTSLYDGTVNFIADDTGTEVRLRQVTDGVETYDLENGTSYASAVDVTSANTSFTASDVHTGVQAHFGAESTLQYFQDEHGRDSYDGNGAILRSYVSYSTDYVNAFWDGSRMTYGDGDGVNYGPLVSLDIVGHEVAHGVTGNSAGLIYQNESGALNESFSDIFGEAIENFATGSNNWLMGHDIGIGGSGAFRSMADPNIYGHPDTYLGDFWFTGTGDNGGVHTNSGVQNKWFYILSEGEAGTNDNGDDYDVTGIGMQEAGDISYRNLTVYLNQSSNYEEAREGAIQSAIDLFGADSQQHLSTIAAWDAVGVYGPPPPAFNFAATSSMGSGIYRSDYSGPLAAGVADEILVDLDANQTLSVQISGSGGLTPTLELRDPSGTLVASDSGGVAAIQNVPVDTGGTWSVSIFGANNSSGFYDAMAFLNAGIESELGETSDNNTQQDAEDINGAAVSFGVSDIDRLAIGGFLESKPGVFDTSFESGDVGTDWQLSSSNSFGRIEVTDAIDAAEGSFSLLMDSRTDANYALNEAILTVDLDPAIPSILTFSHAEFGDETDALPATFNGSFDGDGVAVSEDGTTWHTILTNTDTEFGSWTEESFDLNAFAQTAGISLGANFQIKFQQYDNYEATTDGRAYDAIDISTGEASDDWYSFDVAADEKVSLSVAPAIRGSNVSVNLYDASGDLVRSGVSSANYHSVISDFSSTTNETFYAVVQGDRDIEYGLFVSRGAAIDVAESSPIAIDLHQGVAGFLEGAISVNADADSAANDGDVVSSLFPGVTLSNNVGGGDIFAPAASFAPTGTRVFGPTSTGADGFRDGDNELRADFQISQRKVSIDVGSDDGSDIAWFRAYDAQDNLLEQQVSSALSEGESETLTITRTEADIAYVLAAGVGGDITPLDNLTYSNGEVSEDIFTIDLDAGDELSLSATLPGAGPHLFDNGLDQASSQLIVELVDPKRGIVATHSEQIDHTAAESGIYEIKVTSTGASGEYLLRHNVAEEVSVDVSLGDGTNNRSVVDSLTLTFDDIVSVQEGDLVLTQRETGQDVDLTWTIDDSAGYSVVDLSFSGALTENGGSLSDGNYQVTVRGSIIGSSTDFVFGDEEADGFYRFFGDADTNRTVNVTDLLPFRRAFRSVAGDANYDDRFDSNGDDRINAIDLLSFRRNYRDSLPWV